MWSKSAILLCPLLKIYLEFPWSKLLALELLSLLLDQIKFCDQGVVALEALAENVFQSP